MSTRFQQFGDFETIEAEKSPLTDEQQVFARELLLTETDENRASKASEAEEETEISRELLNSD